MYNYKPQYVYIQENSLNVRVRRLAYIAYLSMPTFIDVCMILDMLTLTCMLIFSLRFFKVQKFSGSYNAILFKNLV